MQVTLKPNLAYDVVTDRLRAEGFQAYAVGGCVRDAVMGVAANDIDVATEARPHDLTKVFGVRSWDGDSENVLAQMAWSCTRPVYGTARGPYVSVMTRSR